MSLSPSQTGLLRTSGCWSHFSAPPPGHWLYCEERPAYCFNAKVFKCGHVRLHAHVCVFAGFTILRARPSPQLSPALPPGSPAYGPPRTKNIQTQGGNLGTQSTTGSKRQEPGQQSGSRLRNPLLTRS